MAIQAPILNPIRFYKATELPNYSDRWPNMDNISFYVEWQKGIFASEFYRDFVLNKQMLLQFRFDSEITDSEITVYKWNESTELFDVVDTLVPLNISPPGWILTPVYLYSWIPSEKGVYYFDFDDADLISDRFIVHNDPKFLKRLVEVNYFHYENRYGMIYYSGPSQVFTGFAYFQGRLAPGELNNEISEFQDDPGEIQLLRATPQRSATIEIFSTHYVYSDLINMIFSNSEIFINGVQYQNTEVPTTEKIPDSDLINATVKVFQKNNDYFIK